MNTEIVATSVATGELRGILALKEWRVLLYRLSRKPFKCIKKRSTHLFGYQVIGIADYTGAAVQAV